MRKLSDELSPEILANRFQKIRYRCSGKHKSNPYIYGAEPYRGGDSDRSLCDEHAGFTAADLEQQRIDQLFARAKSAGLVGNLIWTVDNSGWIYELQVTNAGQNEWHGYPLLPGDPFARQVWARFARWADAYGSDDERAGARNCALLYGYKP